ncbi:phage portal protein [Lacticaseibacillus parakribbianus]|uniref:phage portal protein n=1 Tax=Lacticaseibacillus parakribbianus TaxID=2970927 RepID=UPI0021CB68A3|nr:phage portal protein [Lacticaseibacillus parakribbianus]
MPIFTIKNKADPFAPASDNYEDVLNFAIANSGSSGQYVSADRALHNSDIYSVVMQLASDLATINYRATSKRMDAFVANPSATSNGHSFWTSVFAQLLLSGESFVYRWRNVNGVDVRWEYLRPSQVNAFQLSDGSGLIYNLAFDEPDIGLLQAVPQNDVLHFRLLSKNGGMTAISPLSALADELNIKKANNKLTLDALSQAVTAPGVLKVTKGGLLNAKEKATRSREFMAQQQQSNGGPIVLDDLEDYSKLEVQSNVAQLLSQTDWTAKQIAKVYGIPDTYVNGQGDQQSSVDQITGMYVKALNRYAQSAVSELNVKCAADFEADLWPVIDPMGSNFAAAAVNMRKGGIIDSAQAVWLLKNTGYLRDDMPDATTVPAPITEPPKGGENE